MRRTGTLMSATALLLVGTALLAGCSDDEGSGPQGPGEDVSMGETLDPSAGATELPEDVAASTTDLREAVRTFSDALLTGDGDLAYAFYTAECQTQVPRGTYLLIVRRAGEVYGEPLPFATYEATTRDGGDGGDEVAEVDYTFRGADGLVQEDEEWTLTDAGWRLSDC